MDDNLALPVVMADARWLCLVEDLGVLLSARSDALIWICGERGSGKSSLLRALVPALPGGAIELDIRREADILASDGSALARGQNSTSIAPALILDNVSPADLITFMASKFSVARELLTGFPGPVLLLGPDSAAARSAIQPLQLVLGRRLDCFAMPGSNLDQKLAVLTAHQPIIEKRWHVEFAPGVVEYIVTTRHASVALPGAMLQWTACAAARLCQFAERGPLDTSLLQGKADSVRRQWLLALARHQPTEPFERLFDALAVERAASEVLWHERNREGRLRLLEVDDLRAELDCLVAAEDRSGHYVAEKKPVGDLEFA